LAAEFVRRDVAGRDEDFSFVHCRFAPLCQKQGLPRSVRNAPTDRAVDSEKISVQSVFPRSS
jgi:hypothetical protein